MQCERVFMFFLDKLRELKPMRFDDMAGVQAHEREIGLQLVSDLMHQVEKFEEEVRLNRERLDLMKSVPLGGSVTEYLSIDDIKDVIHFGGDGYFGDRIAQIIGGKEEIMKKVALTDPKISEEFENKLKQLLVTAKQLKQEIVDQCGEYWDLKEPYKFMFGYAEIANT